MLDFNVAILTVEFHGIPIFAVSFRYFVFFNFAVVAFTGQIFDFIPLYIVE